MSSLPGNTGAASLPSSGVQAASLAVTNLMRGPKGDTGDVNPENIAATATSVASAAASVENARLAGISAGAAATEATRATTARVDSEAARAAAQTAKTDAETARTAAQTARAAAEAARDAALVAPFDGAPIPSGVNLNTIVRRGVYRQGTGSDATQALNYPAPGTGGVMEVLTPNGRDTHIIQRYTPFGQGPVAQGRVFYERMQETDSSGWRPWRAYSSQRVDQTAGRAVYTWDDLNNREQLIYGDTGRRDMRPALLNGWTANRLEIRRVGFTVFLSVDWLGAGASTSETYLDIPYGFQPADTFRGLLHTATTPVTAYRTNARTFITLNARSTTQPNSGGELSWVTSDPWPTALPGAAL